MSVRVAILASGRGSNFEAIVNAIESQKLDAQIVALISDVTTAPVVEKAKSFGVPAFTIPIEAIAGERSTNTRQRHEERILEQLDCSPCRPDFLILAGYRRIIGATLLEAFRSPRGYSRIVNVHPSLLPAFPGLHSYAQAFEYGVKVTGVTVHLVEAGVDTGPVCAQEAFSISDCTSVEEVEARGLAIEHRLLPATLEWLLKEKFEITCRDNLSERRLCVCPN